MTPSFDLVDTVVRATSGSDPAWRFFVPGRIEVFGKHTDYAGGRSLVGAVPRGFAVAASPASDGRVVVADALAGESMEYALDGAAMELAGWRRYPGTVISRLQANFPDADLSARVAFASDLPQASGISSSSALVIAIAEALVTRSGIETSDRWTAAIRTPEDRAVYFACIENGASFGSLAGRTGIGTYGGSEDHAAILMSGAGELRQFSFTPLHLERAVAMPPGWTFVIASSGVRANKGGGARDDFNRLAAAAAAIRSAWQRRHPGDMRTLGELHGAEELHQLDLPPALLQRLEQFTAENERVAHATEAFACADIACLGRLAEASQDDAERLLGNQVRETTHLVALARSAGASAASTFGAGWGGSVWALVPSADADAWLEEWLRAYRRRYPDYAATGFVSPPGGGLRRF